MSQSKAEQFIEYVFGKFDWERVLDERMTPPWPLEAHAKAMGLERHIKHLINPYRAEKE